MKNLRLLAVFIIVTNITKGQVYSFDDIFKINKIYFFGYDFTKAKVMESSNIGNDQVFMFGIIQCMNETRKEKTVTKILKKRYCCVFSKNCK